MTKKILFPNGGMADQAIETPTSPDMQTLVCVAGSAEMFAKTNLIDRVDLPAFSENWISDATVAYVTENLILLKGTFTSTVANNSDPIAAFPNSHAPDGISKFAAVSNLDGTEGLSIVSVDGGLGALTTTAIIGNGDTIELSLLYLAAIQLPDEN
jgi:hypothetical protein